MSGKSGLGQSRLAVSGGGMTICIGIAAYNTAPLIGQALNSLLTQSHPPDEVIIIDDGSLEPIAPAVAPYMDRLPIRLIVFPHNRGVYAVRKTIAETANSAFVAFLDSDDQLRPDALAQFSVALAQDRTDIVFADLADIGTTQRASNAPKTVMDRDTLQAAYYGTQIATHFPRPFAIGGKCLRTSTLRKSYGIIGDIDGLSHTEDTLLLLVFMAYANGASVLSDIVYDYHYRPGSLMNDRSDQGTHDSFRDSMAANRTLWALMQSGPEEFAVLLRQRVEARIMQSQISYYKRLSESLADHATPDVVDYAITTLPFDIAAPLIVLNRLHKFRDDLFQARARNTKNRERIDNLLTQRDALQAQITALKQGRGD